MTDHDFEFQGRTYRVCLVPDEYEAPWECEDRHGPVRTANRHVNDCRPGEIVLHTERGTLWLYDRARALELACDVWGCADPIAAVDADIQRLQGWLTRQWVWTAVTVQELVDDNLVGPELSLGGVKSDADESHIRSIVLDLIHEIDSSGESLDAVRTQIRRVKLSNVEDIQELLATVTSRIALTVNELDARIGQVVDRLADAEHALEVLRDELA